MNYDQILENDQIYEEAENEQISISDHYFPSTLTDKENSIFWVRV
jgi:hypothetical protein